MDRSNTSLQAAWALTRKAHTGPAVRKFCAPVAWAMVWMRGQAPLCQLPLWHIGRVQVVGLLLAVICEAREVVPPAAAARVSLGSALSSVLPQVASSGAQRTTAAGGNRVLRSSTAHAGPRLSDA